MNIFQRREMGLTIGNIRRATKQLLDDGTITTDTPRDEMAAAVLNQLVVENPKAFADPSLDWDALLAFIERLLPIILQIIALFA